MGCKFALHTHRLTSVTLLVPYLEPEFDSRAYRLHTREIASGLRRWYVGFDLEFVGKNERVKAILREKTSSIGLYAEPDKNMIPYTNQDIVWMTQLRDYRDYLADKRL